MTTPLTTAPTHIPTAADAVLEQARNATSGRAAHTLIPGAGSPLKQTLVGLTAGTVLADHENPGVATVHVLLGEVRLTSGDGPQVLDAGAHAPIPQMRHGLEANDDAVVLITIASTQDDH